MIIPTYEHFPHHPSEVKECHIQHNVTSKKNNVNTGNGLQKKHKIILQDELFFQKLQKKF